MPLDDRRYSITEVSGITDVPKHVLRQWEARFAQLKPRRDNANRRYYRPQDITMVQRIKELHWDEGLTTDGVNKRLTQEARGHKPPKTNQEVIDLSDAIAEDVRQLLDMLDKD